MRTRSSCDEIDKFGGTTATIRWARCTRCWNAILRRASRTSSSTSTWTPRTSCGSRPRTTIPRFELIKPDERARSSALITKAGRRACHLSPRLRVHHGPLEPPMRVLERLASILPRDMRSCSAFGTARLAGRDRLVAEDIDARKLCGRKARLLGPVNKPWLSMSQPWVAARTGPSTAPTAARPRRGWLLPTTAPRPRRDR